MPQDELVVLAALAASQGSVNAFLNVISRDAEEFVSNPTTPFSALSLLLTFLPESLEPDLYVPGCLVLCQRNLPERMGRHTKEEILDESLVEIGPDILRKRAQAVLDLVKVRSAEWLTQGDTELYVKWSKTRIRNIDQATGLLDFTLAFIQQENVPTDLVLWYAGVVNVICQLRLLHNVSVPLDEFEQASAATNISILLQRTNADTVERDFEKLVVPFLSYIKEWSSIQGWIISKRDDLSLLQPIAYIPHLAKPLLVACYLCSQSDENSFNLMLSIHRDLSVNQPQTKTTSTINPPESFNVLSLLSSDLTTPSKSSLDFFQKMVTATQILSQRQSPFNLQMATQLYFSDKIDQQLACESFIKHCSSYHALQANIRTLSSTVFSHIPRQWLDQRVLNALLETANFELAKEFFSTHSSLVSACLEAFYKFYDSATNGNKTRGSMKNASQCIDLLLPLNKSNIEVERAAALLEATDRLSAFSLTLTPGVHLKPVDIRNHQHPLDLVHRVLELNHDAYFDVDDLTRIAEQLIFSHSGSRDYSQDTAARVRAMCVQASLVNNDFRTAYRYCLAGLIGSEHPAAWVACLGVGKYVSPEWDQVPRTVLEEQLTILSHTLQICPTEDIPTVLLAWKTKETVLASYWQEESNNHSDTAIDAEPRGIKNSSIMSASKIAKALSSSAAEFTRGNADGTHMRKRDQLSNILVSGLGWAIGAKSSSAAS